MELLFQSAINLNRLSSSDKAYHILKVIRNLNEENIWYCMVNLMIIMIVSSILRWLRFSATVIYITVFIGTQYVSARPLADNAYELCDLPRDFPDNNLFYYVNGLHCCKCLKHQVVGKDCTQDEPQNRVCVDNTTEATSSSTTESIFKSNTTTYEPSITMPVKNIELTAKPRAGGCPIWKDVALGLCTVLFVFIVAGFLLAIRYEFITVNFSRGENNSDELIEKNEVLIRNAQNQNWGLRRRRKRGGKRRQERFGTL